MGACCVKELPGEPDSTFEKTALAQEEPRPASRPPPVKQRNEASRFPLHVAAANGNLQSVRRLVENGEDPNSLNAIESTPLHEAAQMGRIDVVKYLVSARADTDCVNVQGYTPYAVARDWSPCPDVVRYLETLTVSQGAAWDRK
mmetsp:Transcript_113569/g.321281  ORF Transcript_113569/g.321281 Transcript_113569/m.321281 type:complete len:144 (-) Transcript_113569:186-617(-)|eukprot:CAMPEP_0117468576 /NCGR_PEP_ID=MMETSP0784-20121206/6249_1 /TAXON_ID=39447 /ORGANISM="" /LENGTH=143 /DNA_ID=CAMNT_0005262593 /DNA_START=37 /DNA_END=468 /DNA_ORIENTATION=-